MEQPKQKHVKMSWVIIVLLTVGAILGGIIAWVAFDTATQDQVNSSIFRFHIHPRTVPSRK